MKLNVVSLVALSALGLGNAFKTILPTRVVQRISAVSTNFDLNSYLEAKKKIVDVALDKSLSATDKNVEKIVESMRYSLLAGGKRVRPILCLVSRYLLLYLSMYVHCIIYMYIHIGCM